MGKKIVDRHIKEAELKLCSFLEEHNLPLRTMDHLVPLMKSCFPDSVIAKGITGGRTKATGIVLNILKAESFAQIINDLKLYPFSMIIDETTNVATKKIISSHSKILQK